MPNPSVIAGVQALSEPETAFGGYTHKAIITAADLQALATAVVTSQVFNIATIPVGMVLSNPAAYVYVPFTFSDGTILVGTISVGDTGSGTAYLAASNVQGTGATSPVALGASYADTGSRVIKAYSATNTLQLTFTVTATKVLNTATAGEVHIFWEQRQLAELVYPQQ